MAISNSFSLFSLPTSHCPFKNETKPSSSSMGLKLLTNSHILCFPSPTSSSVKPIFSKSFQNPLRVTKQQQQQYVYPDPIPEFAEFETHKFRSELLRKLSKSNESFGDDLDMVVNVCSEIFSNFLCKEYGGPGTLLVEPFTDMLVALKEKRLPGAPVAARAALLWAQNYLDKDWELWNKNPTK